MKRCFFSAACGPIWLTLRRMVGDLPPGALSSVKGVFSQFVGLILRWMAGVGHSHVVPKYTTRGAREE